MHNLDGSAKGSLDLAIAPGGDLGTGDDLGDQLVGDLAVPSPSCTGKAITKSGALNFDIKTVTVTGTVTVDGVPTFEAIEFVATAWPTFSATVTYPGAAAGDHGYTVNLAPGKYDVYDNDSIHPGRVMSGVVVTSSTTTLDIAVATATAGVAGKVTVNGAAPAKDEGSIVFIAADGTLLHFDVKGGAYGGGNLLAGTYDIAWAPGNTCTATPCVGRVLQKSVMFPHPTHIDLDLSMVTVSGNISINGADRNAADGGAPFFALRGGTTAQLTVPKGVVNYAVNLLPGTYDIGWQGAPAACAYSPCNRGIFMPGVSFTTTKTLDLPVPMIAISGAITVNHAPANSSGNGCGAVTIGELPIVTSAGRYQVNLLPGSYDIAWVGAGHCDTVPWSSGTLLHKSLSASTQLDVDVPMIVVNVHGKLNGMVLPGGSVLALTFTPVGAPASAAAWGYLDADRVNLIPGVFNIGFSNGNGGLGQQCQVGYPCNGALLMTDVRLSTSRDLDVDVPMITMSGTVTLNGKPFAGGQQEQIRLQPVTGGASAVIDLRALPFSVSLVPGGFTATFIPYSASICRFDGTPCSPEALIDCK